MRPATGPAPSGQRPALLAQRPGVRARPPLSHHEMLAHVGPFSRRGLRVDLSASDRARRVVVFKPSEPSIRGVPQAHYELYLAGDDVVLIRIATLDARLRATATGQGDDIEALLRAFEALPVERHFVDEGGVAVAHSFDLDPTPGSEPALTGCAALIGEVLIETDARTVVGEPMSTSLRVPPPRDRYDFPDDLLTLTHRAWRPLTETDAGWSSTLKVPVREPARSRATARRFARMVREVATILGRPPADYHRRYRARRWRIWARRLVPALVCVAIVASLPILDIYVLDSERAMHPAFLSLPPLLMVGAMLLTWRDTPRIELPPPPRPLRQGAWPAQPEPVDRT